jgi:hypothetical protein
MSTCEVIMPKGIEVLYEKFHYCLAKGEQHIVYFWSSGKRSGDYCSH